jgi:hypothetical protein
MEMKKRKTARRGMKNLAGGKKRKRIARALSCLVQALFQEARG